MPAPAPGHQRRSSSTTCSPGTRRRCCRFVCTPTVGDDCRRFSEIYRSAVEAELPGTLLQWDDFATVHAPPVLGRNQVPVVQAKNVYVLPAVGLAAVVACRATRVTDWMMVAAARAVGEYAVRAGADGATPLLPPLAAMRDAARQIALAVAKAAVEDGVAPEATEAELRAAVSATQWTPQYV